MPHDLPRFAPEIPFPPYTYIPGRAPHPISDPAGHWFGLEPAAAPRLVGWQQSDEFRRGIDLFNHGYYWEAHEVWEGLWQAAGRTGPLADVLKGLIKLAAAGVKTVAGSLNGRRRHALRAAELFDQASNSPTSERNALQTATGLSLCQLASWARDAAIGDGSIPEFDSESEPDPRRVFSFQLLPAC